MWRAGVEGGGALMPWEPSKKERKTVGRVMLQIAEEVLDEEAAGTERVRKAILGALNTMTLQDVFRMLIRRIECGWDEFDPDAPLLPAHVPPPPEWWDGMWDPSGLRSLFDPPLDDDVGF